MTIKKLFFIFILFPYSAFNYAQQNSSEHTITVFVHGTYAMRKIVQYTPFRSIMYCKQGLHLAKELPANYIFHRIAQSCALHNPKTYNLDHFYVFGWKSEHLFHERRLTAAQDLITALKKVVTSYHQTHKVIPNVQLIGFSHGGNVILNTANFLPLMIQEQQIPIDIWLFGTPVQKVNQNLINSCAFRSRYAIYSETDWLQRMDPQGLKTIPFDLQNCWSERMFPLPTQCIQIKIQVNNKSIAHSYYRYVLVYLSKIQELVYNELEKKHDAIMTINLKI